MGAYWSATSSAPASSIDCQDHRSACHRTDGDRRATMDCSQTIVEASIRKVGRSSKAGILRRPQACSGFEEVLPRGSLQRRRLPLWPRLAQHLGRRCLGKQVSFCPSVRVIEFQRTIGSHNAVPQDGSLLPLALGRRTRTSVTLLSNRQGDRKAFEDRCYLSARVRCRILRKVMGNRRFAGTWVRCKREIGLTLRSRRLSRRDPQTRCFEFMATSPVEARQRALALARELRLTCVRPQSVARPLQRPGSDAARARAAKRVASKDADLPCRYKRRPYTELAFGGA